MELYPMSYVIGADYIYARSCRGRYFTVARTNVRRIVRILRSLGYRPATRKEG